MRPVVFVRYNPDFFKVSGVSQNVFEPKNVKGIVDVVYLFYDEFRAAEAIIEVIVSKWNNELKMIGTL